MIDIKSLTLDEILKYALLGDFDGKLLTVEEWQHIKRSYDKNTEYAIAYNRGVSAGRDSVWDELQEDDEC